MRKAKRLILIAIILTSLSNASMAAEQFEPPLSLAKAAQIADAALTQAHLPYGQFLRSIRIQYLPNEKYCYLAYYEPPILTGWVAGAKPPPVPTVVHYLQINMDGTTTFKTQTIPPSTGK
jgi:hypothetical protein